MSLYTYADPKFRELTKLHKELKYLKEHCDYFDQNRKRLIESREIPKPFGHDYPLHIEGKDNIPYYVCYLCGQHVTGTSRLHESGCGMAHYEYSEPYSHNCPQIMAWKRCVEWERNMEQLSFGQVDSCVELEQQRAARISKRKQLFEQAVQVNHKLYNQKQEEFIKQKNMLLECAKEIMPGLRV